MNTEQTLEQTIHSSAQPIRNNNPPSLPLPPSIRFQFRGTGGELCKEMLLGFLLCTVTLGIYFPWFIVKLRKYFVNHTILLSPAGPIQLSFTGTGGECFKVAFFGYLLTMLTFFIYFPWFWCNVIRFVTNNTVGTTPDGTKYHLEFSGTGGEFIGPLFISMFLTVITAGIYAPWAICKIRRLTLEKTGIYQESIKVGQLVFRGSGGDLIFTYLLGGLLTSITCGLYAPWFKIQMEQFFLSNTEIEIDHHHYRGDFFGAGWDLLMIMLSALFIPLTLGIYYFWYFAKLQGFFLNHTGFRETLPHPEPGNGQNPIFPANPTTGPLLQV